MLDVLKAKYDQHAHIRRLVNSTGNMPIVEDTAGASYQDNEWGCGWDGKGKNLLGVLWMQVRAQKRDGKSAQDAATIAATLQKQSYAALSALPHRQGLLLQNAPGVTRVTNTGHVSTNSASPRSTHVTMPFTPSFALQTANTGLQALANQAHLVIPRGCSYTIPHFSGDITYGISGQFNSFYINGTGRSGQNMTVYLKNGQIYENHKAVAPGGWNAWAYNEVARDFSARFRSRVVAKPR